MVSSSENDHSWFFKVYLIKEPVPKGAGSSVSGLNKPTSAHTSIAFPGESGLAFSMGTKDSGAADKFDDPGTFKRHTSYLNEFVFSPRVIV